MGETACWTAIILHVFLGHKMTPIAGVSQGVSCRKSEKTPERTCAPIYHPFLLVNLAATLLDILGKKHHLRTNFRNGIQYMYMYIIYIYLYILYILNLYVYIYIYTYVSVYLELTLPAMSHVCLKGTWKNHFYFWLELQHHKDSDETLEKARMDKTSQDILRSW